MSDFFEKTVKTIINIVLPSLILVWALISIIRLSSVFVIYTDIANWLSLYLNIDDTVSNFLSIALTAVLVPAIPFFFWYFTLGRYKTEVIVITIVFSIVAGSLLYIFGKDVYFHPITGKPIRYYASTPDGVIFSRSPGYDKKFRIEFKPVIPEIIASLENKKIGVTPKKIALSDITHNNDFTSIEFFSSVDGSPMYYYYESPDGKIEMFSNAGIHPQYREPLKVVTPEVITKLKFFFEEDQAAKKAVQVAKEAAKAAEINTYKAIDHYLVKNDVVIDKKTNLMWRRCSFGQQWNGQTCIGEPKGYNYDEADEALKIARDLAEKYRWNGYANWRLPSKRELESLVELEYVPTAINPIAFPNVPENISWLSKSSDDSFARINFINHNDGRSWGIPGEYGIRFVRNHNF